MFSSDSFADLTWTEQWKGEAWLRVCGSNSSADPFGVPVNKFKEKMENNLSWCSLNFEHAALALLELGVLQVS